MKNNLTVVLFVAFGILKSQNGVYCEGEVKMEGLPKMFAKMMDMKIKSYNKKDKNLIEQETKKGPMKTLTVGDNVTFTNENDCYEDKKSEIAKFMDNDFTFENVVVKNYDENKKILIYECKKAIITYIVKSKGTNTENEVVVWFTGNLEGVNNLAGVQGSENDNDYIKALKNLNGCILSTEQTVKNTKTKAIYMITKLEFKDLADDIFKLDTKNCEKMMNYKEFRDLMKKRSLQAAIDRNLLGR